METWRIRRISVREMPSEYGNFPFYVLYLDCPDFYDYCQNSGVYSFYVNVSDINNFYHNYDHPYLARHDGTVFGHDLRCTYRNGTVKYIKDITFNDWDFGISVGYGEDGDWNFIHSTYVTYSDWNNVYLLPCYYCFADMSGNFATGPLTDYFGQYSCYAKRELTSDVVGLLRVTKVYEDDWMYTITVRKQTEFYDSWKYNWLLPLTWMEVGGPVDPLADPYSGGGSGTDPSGETGDNPAEWQLPQDEVAMGGSTYNDFTAGVYRAYAMTASQLNDFSDQLWNTNVLDALSRYLQNPADLVLGLYSYPFNVDSSSTATNIGFNWCDAWGLSSIVASGYPISTHLQHITFGYIEIPHYSETFYDYAPYSGIQIHLPYIGFVPLKMSEVVGRKIYIDYYVDLLSGDFTAELSVNGSILDPEGIPVIGLYQGNIAKPMPISQQNMGQIYKKLGETAVATLVAGAAAGVASMAQQSAEDYNKLATIFDKDAEAGISGAAENAESARAQADTDMRTSKAAGKFAIRTGIGGVANAALNMQGVNAPITRNGSLDGSNGRTSSQECFALISVPDQSKSLNQKMLGFPANIDGPLTNVSGYTEVRDIRLHSDRATASEMAEIEQILRGGIII